ncbi:MAG: cupredoxin domain-containing protein [Gaiellaceae bacterium]
MRFRGLVAVSLIAASTVAAAAYAADGKLSGTVGPGFSIRLVGADGAAVQRPDPGTYELVVDDRSEEHNFHLRGPGVDVTTAVEDVGEKTFTVTLKDGRYTFVCDPHASQMRGAFDVGAGAPPPPPPPTPAPAPAKKLNATVGPGATISLRSPAGARVLTLKAGAYVITVRDRTKLHNFHLTGVGVNRKTGVARVATVTWNLTLKRGKLVFLSDKSPLRLRGTVTVS